MQPDVFLSFSGSCGEMKVIQIDSLPEQGFRERCRQKKHDLPTICEQVLRSFICPDIHHWNRLDGIGLSGRIIGLGCGNILQ
jgi:hypothetical protein